jgi:septum formation protein
MSKRIVLGSGSPRRKELLAGLGFAFEVRTRETEEQYPATLAPELVPEYLAKLKAEALLPDLADNEIILCADTIVLLGGNILGKPNNREEAIRMLSDLSGKTHQVITGVFIGNAQEQLLFSDTTAVTFTNLTQEELENYVDRYQPFDKAGAYGVQEWMGYAGVKELIGSYTNVMGLPTHLVYAALKNIL